MDFQDYKKDILAAATTVGGTLSSPAQRFPKHADAIVAASAKVLADKGIEWCTANERQFTKEIWSQLSFWWKAAFFVAGFFIPGGAVWLTLIQYFVPIIFNYLVNQPAGMVSAGDISVLGSDAETFIKGMKHAT